MTTYRVAGTLLATYHRYPGGRNIAELEHDEITVQATVTAFNVQLAAVEAAWYATLPYTAWRWKEPPQVEEAT